MGDVNTVVDGGRIEDTGIGAALCVEGMFFVICFQTALAHITDGIEAVARVEATKTRVAIWRSIPLTLLEKTEGVASESRQHVWQNRDSDLEVGDIHLAKKGWKQMYETDI